MKKITKFNKIAMQSCTHEQYLLNLFMEEFYKFLIDDNRVDYTLPHVETIKEENMDLVYDYLYENFKIKFELPFPQYIHSHIYDCYYLDSEYRKTRINPHMNEDDLRIYFTSYGGMCVRDDKNFKKRIHIVDNFGNELLIPTNGKHISLKFTKNGENRLILTPVYYNRYGTRNLK